MDAPLLLKNTGTCLILCDSNGKPLPGQLSLSVSNDGLVPAVTVTFALDNEHVRLCGEGMESRISSMRILRQLREGADDDQVHLL